jgi:hypothetical protein
MGTFDEKTGGGKSRATVPLKGVALKFSADIVHPLSCERPFEHRRHLIQHLGYCTYTPLVVAFIQPHTDFRIS